MTREIEPQYDPAKYENSIFQSWLDAGCFHSEARNDGDPYSIMIPPPNVTGILHMGHALNNTIQDILVRRKRMQGNNTVWMPGTDHAGIATQNVVERKLAAEDKTKDDLGRDAFIEEIWKWKEHHGNTIINQLKKMGCSCDWERERFTMDEGLSRAVAEVFIRLFKKGLVYRGNYIINWCPRCLTALSDEEAEHRDQNGKLWYIKYPLKDGSGHIMVATTRPETMLGDTAVAVSPDDERFAHLIGKEVILPVIERVIPVIADEWVDSKFGTGAVKVTPAHDPNDFEMARRHNLPIVNVMEGNGIMNENAGKYKGTDRFECRKALVKELESKGLLDRIEDHALSVRHCYRCHTVIEPRISDQWFVRMAPLAEPAIKAVREGKIKFYPERWTKVYLEWMENIRDWCISRQIWWGHRIPIWYCQQCGEVMASVQNPDRCTKCDSSHLRQDKDVLDTWFSSWLWPFSTWGWPDENEDLKFYYPTDSLVTAQEIIFFWVARMIMAGIEFMGDIPFSKVYIHGTIRDDTGRKMSKSLGNTIDPLQIIEQYGADALRFSLIMITSQGQDVFLSSDKFEIGRNFANKIWNAFRFISMSLGDDSDISQLDKDFQAFQKEYSTDDKYILYRLSQVITQVEETTDTFRFNEAAHALYDFFWHSFCDKYIEFSKESLKQGHPERKRTITVLLYVLKNFLKLLHPFMPYLTENIWQVLQGDNEKKQLLMVSSWPKINSIGNEETADIVGKKYDFLRIARNIRSEYKIAPSRKTGFLIRTSYPHLKDYLSDQLDIIKRLLHSDEVEILDESSKVPAMPSGSASFGTVYMKITKDAINMEEELKRLEAQLKDVMHFESCINKKLSSENFIKKAPQEVVEKERQKLEEALARKTKIQDNLTLLNSL